MPEDDENGKKALSRAEKFKNYGIGIGAMSALLLGIWANVKGEPVANKTWETSQAKLNENRKAINSLGKLFIHMQGQFEGYNNARLMDKITALEKANASLKEDLLRALSASPKGRRHVVKRVVGAPTRAPVVEVLRGAEIGVHKTKKCHPGWVRIEGRCTKSRAKIAKAVDDARKKTESVKMKLLEEKRKRKVLEQRAAQRSFSRPAPPPSLRPVPKKLDDASKLGE